MKRNNRTGERHGCFEVLSFAYVKDARTFWNCRCDCGALVVRDNRYFRKDRPVQKYCTSCFGNRLFKGIGDLGKFHWSRIVKQAKDRDIYFNPEFTIEVAWQLYLDQNRKCVYTQEPLVFGTNTRECTASLDRIDSSKGYTLDNVQWIHKDVNKMKMNLTEARFLSLCGIITERSLVSIENAFYKASESIVKEPNVLEK